MKCKICGIEIRKNIGHYCESLPFTIIRRATSYFVEEPDGSTRIEETAKLQVSCRFCTEWVESYTLVSDTTLHGVTSTVHVEEWIRGHKCKVITG